jgi:hypothetical protein
MRRHWHASPSLPCLNSRLEVVSQRKGCLLARHIQHGYYELWRALLNDEQATEMLEYDGTLYSRCNSAGTAKLF